MIALEIIRAMKRVANPSAVRRTRKARMMELTADWQPCRMRTVLPRCRCAAYSAADNLNDR